MDPRASSVHRLAREDPMHDHHRIRESDDELVRDPVWPREIAFPLYPGGMLAGDTLLVREPVSSKVGSRCVS